jgi:hypothetical protein
LLRSASTPALLLVTLVAIPCPCLVQAFCCFGGVEISTPMHPFNRRSLLFSLFGNLILVQANASFSLSQNCQSCLYEAITCENAPTRFLHSASLLLILKPTWHGMRMEWRWSPNAIYQNARMCVLHLSVLHDQGQLPCSSSSYLWESLCKTLLTGFDPRLSAHIMWTQANLDRLILPAE